MRRAALLLAVALAGCGAGEEAKRPLTVSAASSLQTALEPYARRFDARLAFGGSDALAAQLRRGVRPDVFASADVGLVRELFRQELVERPVAFATNELVLAVTPRSPVGTLADVGLPGVKLAIGAPGVPVGDYARFVLERLDPAAEANVRTREPSTTGIVAKLRSGAADAGFVYLTDVETSQGALRAIDLPPRLRPRIVYAAAVVEGAQRPDEAARFVKGLAGARALRRAGFGPAP